MCKVACAYTVENVKFVGQKELQNELKAHKHPTSRRLMLSGKPWANVEQQTLELIDHYLFFHK